MCDDELSTDHDFVSFPSIKKFRHLLKNIPYVFHDNIPDTLTFLGTVKLHGTNASVIMTYGENGRDSMKIQSRN